jgi:hypothetical protein
MKDRILKGWNFRRAMYLIVAGIAVAQAIYLEQYLLILFGLYFGSMAIFNFGCAAGTCAYEPPRRTVSRRDESNV